MILELQRLHCIRIVQNKLGSDAQRNNSAAFAITSNLDFLIALVNITSVIGQWHLRWRGLYSLRG
jgi:hypothetical protein